MRRVFIICFCSIALVATALGVPDVQAYQFYSDATNDVGGCGQCHTGFRDNNRYVSQAESFAWGDSLHNVHLNNTSVGSSCDNCHGGAGTAGRTVNLSSSAVAADGVNAISCSGCHGRLEDANNVTTDGTGWGAGLRQHHTGAGAPPDVNGDTCLTCHEDSDPDAFAPVGENTMPAWYGSVINENTLTVLDPCNPASDFPEDLSGDPAALGLDNDGDNAYDAADTNCLPPPDIDVSPLALDFGTVTIGNTATLMTTIQNLGGQDLTVTDLTLTGSPDFDFNPAAPTLPFIVPPGGSVDVPVDYTPVDEGSDSGALDIASNDPDEPTVTVSLAGTGAPPAGGCDIAMSPLALDFGSVEVGNVATLSATIQKNGTADCVVDALTVSGADFTLGAGAPNVPFTVSFGQQVDVPIDYAPSGLSGDSGTLDIASDDPDTPTLTVALSGTGIAPRDIDVSPLVLDFGQVPVFSTATRTATISNLGDADLTVTDLTLTGSLDFAFGPSAPSVPFIVPGGGFVDVPIDYTPGQEGPDSGSLDITSDDPDEPIVTVSLSGEGVAPTQQCDIDVSPLALDFGSVEVGIKVTRYVIIDNTGDADCVVSEINLTGDLDFRLNPAAPIPPFTVTPTGFAQGIPIDYTPSDTNIHSATLQVVSNDLDETNVTVAISGTGIPPTPDIQISPLAIDFGGVEVGMTSTRTLAVQNVGRADLTVTGLTLAGSPDFAINPSAPTVPFTVLPGGSVDVPIDYTPGELGGDSGTLEVASDDPDEPTVTASLSGMGIPPQADQDIDVSPLTLDFGSVEQGDTAVLSTTIQNLGERDLTVTGLTVTGTDFTLNPGALAVPFTVPSGGSAAVAVNYTPSDLGDDSGTLEVASDDPDEPNVTVSLSGTGIPPVLECDIHVTPLVLDFGSVEVGDTRLMYAIIDNLGDADCVVDALTLAGSADFELNPATPAVPFVVEPDGLARGVPINYTPSDIGADSGTLQIGSNDPDENPVVVSLVGTGVIVVNQPPVADPNGPYTGTTGVSVQFDGSGSFDSDGTIVSYDWDFGDGASGTGVSPTHTYAAAGTYTVTLTVTDDGGLTDTATTTATITEVPNQPPVADPNGPYTGTTGVSVQFDGSGSFDSDGTIVSYDWDFGDGASGTGVSPTHTYAAAGTYTVTLTVTDDGGLTDSASTTATITEVPNQPPVADPNGPYTGTTGVSVQFDGSGSFDSDGTIVSYDWDFGDGASGTGVSPTHTYAAAGTYTVSLTVIDDGGLTDTATTTAAIEPAVQLVDLDIKRFSVRKNVKLNKGQPVTIDMTVANNGSIDEPRPATVVGTQNSLEVYSETIQVSATPGSGGAQFSFPDYTPTVTGDITWVATIADDDPDIDEATATTTVK